jgi:prephenate dehydratase
MDEVGYLGPVGTYSHLVAEKRFGRKRRLVPLPSISDVCKFASNHSSRMGIVPIENSSGGAIHETVDVLLTNAPKIQVLEELSLDVKLALIGRDKKGIQTLYSHFAPIEHCSTWIQKNLPKAQKRAVESTAIAAGKAADEDNAAALGGRRLAALYGLKVLHFPVQADIPNITTFLLIAGRKAKISGPNIKTTIAARLPNIPGSLCTFLEAFRNENVNLSRIVSRPIRGSPREYAFLVDVEGHADTGKIKKAIKLARKTGTDIRVVGSYPSRHPYKS